MQSVNLREVPALFDIDGRMAFEEWLSKRHPELRAARWRGDGIYIEGPGYGISALPGDVLYSMPGHIECVVKQFPEQDLSAAGDQTETETRSDG